MRKNQGTIPPFKPFSPDVPARWRVRIAEMIAETWASNPKSKDHQIVMSLILNQLLEEDDKTPPGPMTMVAFMLLQGSPERQKEFYDQHGAYLPTAVQEEFNECLAPYED